MTGNALWPWLGLEEEAGQVVPLGHCDSSHRAFLGEGAGQVMGGQQDIVPPPLSFPVP